jgi:hypothetical protein
MTRWNWRKIGWWGIGVLIWVAAIGIGAPWWICFVIAGLVGNLIYLPAIKAWLSAGGSKKCLRCAERVALEAQVCRFCGHEFSSEASTLASPAAATVAGHEAEAR